jgi:ABC-type branched-subunit amino acid transport system permease subunit
VSTNSMPVWGRIIGRDSLTRSAVLSALSVILLGLFSPSWSTLVLIFAMAALGLNLLLGYTGLLSVGQSVYFGLGGYVAAITATHWGFQLSSALIFAVLICVVVAAFIAFFAIRRFGIYFVMITFAFAFAETAHFLAYVFKEYTGGENGVFTGIAGCLYAFFVGSASVAAIDTEMAFTIVIITVLGGIWSLYGSLLGAVVYVALNTYLSDLWPYWEMLLGAALIVIVLVFRGGLHGGLVALGDLVAKRFSTKPPTTGSETLAEEVAQDAHR